MLLHLLSEEQKTKVLASRCHEGSLCLEKQPELGEKVHILGKHIKG